MKPPSRYRFDDVLIDLEAREIQRGGESVEVESKVFDLIALLLAHRDRALSKRELNETIWGHRPVTDAALSQQLRKARRALGDTGDAQRVIRTVHGHGLRWVAAVDADVPREAAPMEAVAVEPVPRPAAGARTRGVQRAAASGRLWWLASIGFAAVVLLAFGLWRHEPGRAAGGVAPAPRIAVLPVANRTGEADLAWAPAGLMGLMASLLAQQGRIDVAPAQTVQGLLGAAPHDAAKSLQALRRALGVSHAVATDLKRLGPLYELDVRLVAAGAAEHHDILHGDNPAALAADAVARVRRWLDLDRAATTTVASGIANPFLAEAYARGLDAQLHGDAAGAARYFSICLDRDPGLAWPRLGLSIAQARSGDQAGSLANAQQVVAAARELEDNDLRVAALRQLASLAFFRGDLDAAAAALDEALAHLPESGRTLALIDVLVAYGSVDDERGQFALARSRFQRALALARDIGSRRDEASVLVNMASIDNEAGDVDAAADTLRAGLDAARRAGDAQLEGAALANLGATESNRGRLLDAVSLLKQAVDLARKRGDVDQRLLATAQLAWAMMPFDRPDSVGTLARQILAVARHDGNSYQEAEAEWVLAGLAERRADWRAALDGYVRAHKLYVGAGLTLRALPVLADAIGAAASAGDVERARALADAFRSLTADGGHEAEWTSRQPLIEAQLRAAAGDKAGATDDLARALDALRGQSGAVAQAMLFQLGRWQVDLGRGSDLLVRTAWKPWFAGHPDAIALRIAALRQIGRANDADAEQQRLDALLHAPELALDPSQLAGF